MGIKIHIHPILYPYTHQQKLSVVTGNTVGQCLWQLDERFPGVKQGLFDKHGNLLPYIDVFVNLKNLPPDKLDTEVSDGDVIHIIVLASGG